MVVCRNSGAEIGAACRSFPGLLAELLAVLGEHNLGLLDSPLLHDLLAANLDGLGGINLHSSCDLVSTWPSFCLFVPQLKLTVILGGLDLIGHLNLPDGLGLSSKLEELGRDSLQTSGLDGSKNILLELLVVVLDDGRSLRLGHFCGLNRGVLSFESLSMKWNG